MPASKKGKREKTVEATRHSADTRLNIPTAELEAFAVEAETQPSTLLYPRDPSLDPQLVWRGKDEQDRDPLAIPVVPVYIQETIEPRALIEDLQAESRRHEREEAPTLFADPFEGLSLEERVDFYRWPGKWTNRMILGDSLLVMTSLAEKEGLRGQVQMIYLDPPYGIKFGSNWQVSTRRLDVKDGKAEDATRQPEQIRAFRDTWELHVHSYLSYLRDRLTVARDLLTESGSIFVQIGDENLHLVRNVLDEVFGSANFVQLIPFRKKTMPLGGRTLEQMYDFILWYSRHTNETAGNGRVKFRQLYLRQDVQGDFHWSWYELPSGERKQMRPEENADHSLLPEGARVYRLVSMYPPTYSAAAVFPFEFDGRVYNPPAGSCWITGPEAMQRLALARRFQPEGEHLRYCFFLDDGELVKLTALWPDTIGARNKTYVTQTSPEVIRRCVLMTTDPGDLVLDPTCGSGTTAYVAEEMGRRWVTIDTSRVALALARTRLMTARYPYFLLVDSPEGQLKEAEVSGLAPASPPAPTEGDMKKGFVYERVSHVTLSLIANNPEITEHMAREEIDAAIARHAKTDILYDRPYRTSRVIRVSGPFTVEGLSPHRVLRPLDIPGPDPLPYSDASRFVERVLDNLHTAGVQNTVKNERLTFDLMERWTGNGYIQGRGEYTEGGRTKVAAICIGPEHGTVGKEMVEAAAIEAIRLADLLIVCGFAFDAYAEGAQALGRLKILQAKINPDLQMPDLLKKTGAGNLFMVFGEPDIDVRAGPEGMVTVEIRGLDVYDPTTGVVRSHSTDDIACWFLDTEYNDRTFFVRARLLLGWGRPIRTTPQDPSSGDRRGSLGIPLQHNEPALPETVRRQDCGEGHQPLRG